MDGMTMANTFATLVGLLSMFKQERKDARTATAQEFMEWLSAHRHQEIKDAISQSFHLSAEVDTLLRQDHKEIIAKLSAMDSVLSAIASHVEGFQGIVHIVNPGAELSDQAVHFLRSLVNSDAEEIAIFPSRQGITHKLIPSGGVIGVSEPRLVSDDLNSLVSLGLLAYRVGSSGTECYGITRNAISLVRLIERKSDDGGLPAAGVP